jgi:spore germination cell wall hydrolase CwlJ-like protein
MIKYIFPLLLLSSSAFADDITLPSTNSEVCLSNNIYHEAKSQSTAGQIAVGLVVINRVRDARFPNTICEVVYQAQYSTWWKEAKGKDVPRKHKCQFSWFCDGKHDRVTDTQAYQKIMQLVKRLLTNRYDGLIEGATHYHADYVNPKWSKTKTLIGQVDDHIFYRWD